MPLERIDYIPACVAGLELAVFGAEAHPGAPVVFVTHGRFGAAVQVYTRCRDLAEEGLIAIAVEQRNHGRRLVDARRNMVVPSTMPDTLGTFVGTASDIKLLVDFLPSSLGLAVDRVGMTGTSLGGFTTLFAMAMDRRIRVGVPINGGCDFKRAIELYEMLDCYSAEVDALVRKYDPIHHAKSFSDRPLLMLNGAEDSVVPIALNRRFRRLLRPHYKDPSRLKLRAYAGVAHEVTEEMWAEARRWLVRWLLG